MLGPKGAKLIQNGANLWDIKIDEDVFLGEEAEAGSATQRPATGVGFFDHMLTHLAKHGLFDLSVKCAGDLHIDAHHTVEDVGLAFGTALVQALGDKAGIRRYGDATVPMDETLVTTAVDLSGRSFLVWKAEVPREILGTFSSQLAEEFWRAVSSSGKLTLHVVLHHEEPVAGRAAVDRLRERPGAGAAAVFAPLVLAVAGPAGAGPDVLPPLAAVVEGCWGAAGAACALV